MAKISWKQLTYNIAQACRDVLGNNNIIKVKDLPDTIRGLGSLSSSTVEPREVTHGEITYNSEGRLIGSAPFTYEGHKQVADITSWEIEETYGGDITKVAYCKDRFIILEYSGTMEYSMDGIDWASAILPEMMWWNDVTYGDGKFIAVGDTVYEDMGHYQETNIAAYSTDGINWT